MVELSGEREASGRKIGRNPTQTEKRSIKIENDEGRLEGNCLWKDAYEALEIAQILLIQQQGKELLKTERDRYVSALFFK